MPNKLIKTKAGSSHPPGGRKCSFESLYLNYQRLLAPISGFPPTENQAQTIARE